jgi:hypothetical protein
MLPLQTIGPLQLVWLPIFAGIFLWTLMGPIRYSAMSSKTWLDGFGTWCAHNMGMEHEPTTPEGVTPTTSEKFFGVRIFVLFEGFVLFCIWRLIA